MEGTRIQQTPNLNDIRIAAPCDVGFENMQGDDRVRFCSLCKLNVYNIGGMSAEDATKLIQETEGRLCLRFYRRKDGTVITDNCPVGLRKIRDRLAKIACFALLLSLIGWLSGHQAYAQGLVGAPVDGHAELLYRQRIRHLAIYAPKDDSGSMLLAFLVFSKSFVLASTQFKWKRETWFSMAYLVPFFCGAAVHFTYLGVTDDIILTVTDGLARSSATGMTFGVACWIVAYAQSRLFRFVS